MAQMEEVSKKRWQRRSYTDEFRAGAVRLVVQAEYFPDTRSSG
jgi:transposase-like protein